MKSLWFLPLAFLAGVDGFILFALYLAIFLACAYAIRAVHEARADVASPLFSTDAPDQIIPLPLQS